MVGLEGGEDLLGFVHEIQHAGRGLAGIGTVQPREGLNGLDAGKALVQIRAAEQRLVEARLESVCERKDLIFAALERLADVASPLSLGSISRCSP